MTRKASTNVWRVDILFEYFMGRVLDRAGRRTARTERDIAHLIDAVLKELRSTTDVRRTPGGSPMLADDVLDGLIAAGPREGVR